MKCHSAPALFLDRDGVVNVDTGYVHNWENFQFIDGIFELCRTAKRKGYRIVIITNQAGLAKGYYTENELKQLHDWMLQELHKNDVVVDAIYYCPFHPDGVVPKFKAHSQYRKPNPGMILQAASELNIELESSVLVGDKQSDIEAGMRAGLRFVYLFDRSAPHRLQQNSYGFVANSLLSIAESLP